MQTSKNLVNFWWFQSVDLDKNLSNYKLFTLIPKLETPQSIALKEQSAELRELLSCCPFLLDLFWSSWECSKQCLILFATEIVFSLWVVSDIHWDKHCKTIQIFSHFMGPTRPLRNTCPSGSFQNPCQTQDSKSCFSLWSQDIEFRLHLYS